MANNIIFQGIRKPLKVISLLPSKGLLVLKRECDIYEHVLNKLFIICEHTFAYLLSILILI